MPLPRRLTQVALFFGVVLASIPAIGGLGLTVLGLLSGSPGRAGVPVVTVLGLIGAAAAWVCVRALRPRGGSNAAGMIALGIGALAGLFGGAVLLAGAGWGRPLRVRGRILHPKLRHGADWAKGEAPAVEGLTLDTRRALEALWLHDAQKEHASVPAFSRLSWHLAALGAPAELLEGCHRAALEEIDHARRCFALAAGYGGQPHTVEAMPDLLVGNLDLGREPLVRLALESLRDGCLLEDFNADVAAACVEACQDPAVKEVLRRIAREERSHAELSWQILEWLHGQDSVRVGDALRREAIASTPRPTALSRKTLPLAARADPAQLLRHGRIPDDRWGELWLLRLRSAQERVDALLGEAGARAA